MDPEGHQATTETAPAEIAAIPATIDAPAQEPAAAESQQPPDWRQFAEQIDPAELEQLNPRVRDYVAGKAGRIAESKIAANQAERDRQDEVRRLKETDPAEIGEEVLRRIDEAEQLARLQATPEIQDRAAAAAHQQYQNELLAVLPETEQAPLRRQIADGRINSYTALYAAIDAANEGARRQKWEAEERPRIEQELLAKHRLSAPRPDLSSGEAPAGAMSSDEWQRNRHDSDWRRANRTRINEAVATGRIRS